MGTDNTVYCRRTGKPCCLCKMGLIPDVFQCENRYKKDEDTEQKERMKTNE